jgi:A/G-specific adenine glycosylase
MSNEQSAVAIGRALLGWWDGARGVLPWRTAVADPYAIWVSEIMAQQTQLATVIPYFERWMRRFPTVQALADAPLDEVLKQWEGLGYYRRARHLHTAAQTIVQEYGGQFPTTAAEWQKLKGVGRYTAGAIASMAWGEHTAVVDGNVTRILTRLYDLPDDISQTPTQHKIWQLATDLVPAHRPGDHNQALMELGQKICTPKTPACHICPLAPHCLARQRGTQLERPVRPSRVKTPHYDVAAGVIWREQIGQGQFLIAQRPAEGLLGGLWEFPGGKQEQGESLAQTLVREIGEELAVQIEVPPAHELPFVQIKHAYTHFRITLYALHAQLISPPEAIQHHGVANHAWVTLAELERYAFAVTDQKIIAALAQG